MQGRFILSCVLLYKKGRIMKAVVQRVKKTTLEVDGALVSEIPFGLVAFLGIKCGDTESQAEYLAKKIESSKRISTKGSLFSLISTLFIICAEIASRNTNKKCITKIFIK